MGLFTRMPTTPGVNRIKQFDPKSLEKVEGEYQLEEMEIRNPQTGSQTVIKFNLTNE